MPIKDFQSMDPADFANERVGAVMVAEVTYASATQTLGTIPANSLVTQVTVVRTTAWDAITTFEVGKSGDTDWLATTEEANVDGDIPSGEDGAAEVVAQNKVVTSETNVVLTLDQGAATEGAGFVVVEYVEMDR